MARRLSTRAVHRPRALGRYFEPRPSRNGHTVATSPVVSRAVPLPRQQMQRINSIRVRSVARVAVIFYFGAFAIMVGGIGIAWFGASRLGVVAGIERMMRSVGFQDFRLLSEQILLGAVMIAVVAVVLCVVLTLVAASLYNAASAPWGGIDVSVTILPDATPHDADTSSPAPALRPIITD
jgi:hypothetical protein